MKVAFATQDQQRVDAHFGWARHLAVYDVDGQGYRFVQDFGFGEDLAEDGDEDKLAPKLAAIGDCAIVYVAAIGGSAAARVVASQDPPHQGGAARAHPGHPGQAADRAARHAATLAAQGADEGPAAPPRLRRRRGSQTMSIDTAVATTPTDEATAAGHVRARR
jgi:nitrogen fixation protein NifX